MISVKDKLDTLLSQVRKPGNYIGGEPNRRLKDPTSVLADMVLTFPDVYELGMSHNGTRVLYHVINREPDLLAERSFAPLPDMAAQLKKNKVSLYSLESYRPLSSFSTVGISLQTELNYTNVPYLLELGGVTAFSKNRGEADPFVIGGGPCMANPEPVVDFFDLFVIGDGEFLSVLLLRIIGESRRKGVPRAEILTQLSNLKGVYVPSLFPMQQNSYGEWVPEKSYSSGDFTKSAGIRRTWVERLDPALYPVENPVPHTPLVHDRFAVEVMRGCTQGCRFCQAGYWYRPNRELPPADIVDLARKGLKATGERQLGLLSLSTADYGQIENVTDYMMSQDDFSDVTLSLPSLRANSFGQGLAAKVSKLGGGRSATFAPETGSERLRKMINKTISDEDMYKAAEGVFANGFHTIKLYTMVGLPTENLSDMEAFCGLIEGLCRIARKYGKSNTIHPSIGIFIPKPFTPMQWSPFIDAKKVWEHISFVRERFRKAGNVRITWADWNISQVESFYSRGDRSLGPMIYKAYQRGMILETHSEHFNYEGWLKIWEEAERPTLLERISSDRELNEIFPWDFIHAGVTKSFLRNEYRKMFKEDAAPVPDCKWGDCMHCGIPGNGLDTQLAKEKIEVPVAPASGNPKEKSQSLNRPSFYLIRFQKTGLSRFISHHGCLNHFQKGFRRLGIRFAASGGFHPRPIMKNIGALPLGMESRDEILLVGFSEPLSLPQQTLLELNVILPEGMQVVSFESRNHGRLPRLDRVEYVLKEGNIAQILIENWRLGNWMEGISQQGKEPNLTENLIRVEVDTGDLFFDLRAQENGATVNPYRVLAALAHLPEEEAKSWTLRKEKSHFQEEKVLELGKV